MASLLIRIEENRKASESGFKNMILRPRPSSRDGAAKNNTVLRVGQGRPQEERTVLHFRLKMNKLDRTFLKSVFINQQITRRGEHRCADSTTRVVCNINAVPKLDRTSMKKLVSKHEKHCKTQLTTKSGLQLCVGKWKSMCRLHHKGSPGKTQVAKVAGASEKIGGPTRRDYCKNQHEPKIWTI